MSGKQAGRPEFTPGPWAAVQGCVYSDDATGSIVSRCTGFQYAPRPDDEMEANAHLIAAAPEMYEAIAAVMASTSDPWTYETLRLALAKAEGRAVPDSPKGCE